jgi:hypothetical protein
MKLNKSMQAKKNGKRSLFTLGYERRDAEEVLE